MNNSNYQLCEKTNGFFLKMYLLGYANVSREWCGEITNSLFSFLYYVDDGNAKIQTKQGVYNLEKGNWYLIPRGAAFKYSCDDHFSHFYAHIRFCGEDNIDIFDCLKEPLCLKKEGIPDFVKDGYLKKELLAGIKIRNFLERIVIEFIEKYHIKTEKRTLSSCVTDAIDYISLNLSANLTADKIAAHSYVSKSTLTKHFRSELNMSIHEYLYQAIFFEAENLLIRNNISIAEISSRLGFSDQFYFSRKFKERYKIPPTAYRKLFLIT